MRQTTQPLRQTTNRYTVGGIGCTACRSNAACMKYSTEKLEQKLQVVATVSYWDRPVARNSLPSDRRDVTITVDI